MTALLHRLGFHGRNWRPIWVAGNLWTECSVCHERRMLSFDDASELPQQAAATEPETKP